jgi:metallophosphoesterase superfamily enzyme
VAADLHLGYDRVRRRGGDAVPSRKVSDELAPLAATLREHAITRLAVAGDLVEDGRVERAEVIDELLAWLAEQQIELVGVAPGNHDRGLAGEGRIPLCKDGIELGGWRVVHGDGERPAGRVVQGHEHPWVRFRQGGEGPCYLIAADHLVLPAYSRDAAGGNVLGARRWESYRCGVIAGGRVLDFGELGRLG